MYRRSLWCCCLLLITLLIISPFAAQADVDGTWQSDDTLKVVWGSSPSASEEWRELVQGYEALYEDTHPEVDVQIEFVDFSDYRNTIVSMVEAGDPPDVMFTNSIWIPEFVSLGLIEPLDRYMTRDFRRQFIPAIINEGAVYQGRTFGLPGATSTRALYYNLDLFEQAGLENPPTTWEELRAASEAISALDGDASGFGLQGGGGLETNTYFYYFVWGNGGDLYNDNRTASAINAPEAVEALTFIKELVDAGATQPNPTDLAYERRRGVEDLFQAGQLGMMISGPWMINRLRTEAPDLRFGIAPLPYNTTPATYGVIDALVMLSTSENKDIAWDFMQSLYTPENRLAYTLAAGVLPELTSVAAAPEFAEDPDLAVFLSLLPDARFEPLHIQSANIARIVIEAIRAVYLGEAEPQAALDNAAAQIDEELAVSVAGW